MIRGVYSVRGGLLDSGLFVASVPALFDRIRSEDEPTYRFFDTVSYTVPNGVHGQECSKSIVRSERSLIERIASRLEVDSHDIDDLIDRSLTTEHVAMVNTVSVNLYQKRAVDPDHILAIQGSGWGYVDTGSIVVPLAEHAGSYVAK